MSLLTQCCTTALPVIELECTTDGLLGGGVCCPSASSFVRLLLTQVEAAGRPSHVVSRCAMVVVLAVLLAAVSVTTVVVTLKSFMYNTSTPPVEVKILVFSHSRGIFFYFCVEIRRADLR